MKAGGLTTACLLLIGKDSIAAASATKGNWHNLANIGGRNAPAVRAGRFDALEGAVLDMSTASVRPGIKNSFALLTGISILAVAGYVSTKNYLLFHTFSEFFTIIVSFAIVVIVYNNYKNLSDSFIPIIGIAYAFAGVFDLLHTLAYEGMGVFPDAGSGLGPQMWIIARFLDSFGMLLAGISLYKSINPRNVFIGFLVVSTVALLLVFYWDIFPVCFIDGQGLTPFKVYSEYVISLTLCISVVLLVHHKNHFHPRIFRLLLAFFILSVCTELTLTFYKYMYGWQNAIGHLFKVTAFFFLYRAIVETSLREPFNLLFFQLNQAYTRLEHFAAELAGKNTELIDFANTVSHDLKAPLINIKGFARELDYSIMELKTLLKNNAASLPESRRSDMERLLEQDIPEELLYIGSAIDRMDRMIAALLKLSRIGRREWNFEEIDMSEQVDGVLLSFKHQIERSNIKVVKGQLPLINNDRLAIEQVFGNLLDNAIKFLDPDRPGEIEISCLESGAEYVFCIQDSGRGIAPEDQQRIFEIFQRSGKENVPGEGMGLAYVKALIARMGGRVWCESELGVGTKICVAVPMVSANMEL